jgi:hypothetical protein
MWSFEDNELLIELVSFDLLDINTIATTIGHTPDECRHELMKITKIWLEMNSTDEIRREALRLASWLEQIEPRREKILRFGCF